MKTQSVRGEPAVIAQAAACGAGAGGAFPCWGIDAVPAAAPAPAFVPAARSRTAGAPRNSERFFDPWR